MNQFFLLKNQNVLFNKRQKPDQPKAFKDEIKR